VNESLAEAIFGATHHPAVTGPFSDYFQTTTFGVTQLAVVSGDKMTQRLDK
jgi:hypothetical protein